MQYKVSDDVFVRELRKHWFSARRMAIDPAVELLIREPSIRIENRRAPETASNDAVLGTLVRFHEGEDYNPRVTNELSEDTSIHWRDSIMQKPMAPAAKPAPQWIEQLMSDSMPEMRPRAKPGKSG